MVTERESMPLNEGEARALGVEERSDETPRARASGARPVPDPEVVAKPKRRQFTAGYRLRILEEAERGTQRGEVGRVLRREGLYSSHLTAWRKARRKGSLPELAAKKRGAKPAERNPLSVNRNCHCLKVVDRFRSGMRSPLGEHSANAAPGRGGGVEASTRLLRSRRFRARPGRPGGALRAGWRELRRSPPSRAVLRARGPPPRRSGWPAPR